MAFSVCISWRSNGKCVSGNLETVTVTNGGNRTSENTSLDVDPLQWSVTAAAEHR